MDEVYPQSIYVYYTCNRSTESYRVKKKPVKFAPIHDESKAIGGGKCILDV